MNTRRLAAIFAADVVGFSSLVGPKTSHGFRKQAGECRAFGTRHCLPSHAENPPAIALIGSQEQVASAMRWQG
jgi:hypothetical protein